MGEWFCTDPDSFQYRKEHGNGKYISLHAIDVKDSTVYLLDSEAEMVLAHDLMFNFKKSFRLNFPALDFIKINDGFLFCNLNTTPELHRFVHTDNDGNIIGSYLPSEMEITKQSLLTAIRPSFTSGMFCMDFPLLRARAR